MLTMYSELVVYPDTYNSRSFPNFGYPKTIGFMSLDCERKYHGDTSKLMFAKNVRDGRVNFDLNLQIENAIRKPPDLNEKITHLLQFLLDQERRLCLAETNELELAQFFCYRGLLTCVACTPYENREPWRIVAVLYKGNVYLCALETEEKRQRNRNMSDTDKKFTSWGYKFEQFVLSDAPDSDPHPEQPLNECEEFSLVFKTHLNSHRIIYGAEMDGICCDQGIVAVPPSNECGSENIIEYLSTKSFIELKTNRHLEFPNQHANFRRFKTKKWWCQSYLAGVNTILCGFRNDDGIVEELKLYNVKELPKMSKKYWDPNVCFNFLDTFLTFVKRCLAKKIRKEYGEASLKNIKKLPLTSLHFEWSPRNPVRVTDTYCHDADPVLPHWFLNNYGKYVNENK